MVSLLVMKLCHVFDAHPALFSEYEHMIQCLGSSPVIGEAALRRFDFYLLSEIGYGIPFRQALAMGHSDYQYSFQMGFAAALSRGPKTFSYQQLEAMANQNWEFPGVLPAAKRLCRLAIAGALGGKSLRCRELF